MNNFKHVFLLILVALTTFNACEKDELENEQSQSFSNQNYELPPELKVNLQQTNGLLVFKDRQQFDQITNLLLSETERYIDMYFSKYDDSLSDEAVNEQVEADEFNPNLVYETFEKHHSIRSLRSKLWNIEDKWLDNEELSGSNPAIYPLSERCLPVANADGEYQIGNNIYRVEKTGIVYSIKNADYKALNYIRNQQMIPLKIHQPNVTIHNIEALDNSYGVKDNCLAYVHLPTEKEYSGKHRMDMILDLSWDGYGSAAKAKTKAYKKKKKLFGGGYRWKREWCAMTAQVHIVDFDIHCNEQGTHDSRIKYKRWAYYVSARIVKAGNGLRTKKGGYFWGRYSTSSINAEYLRW
jgi:hypothetical protein